MIRRQTAGLMIDRIIYRHRVGYPECDPQSMAHHSRYPVWFELARTELLRAQSVAYSELERQGVFMVVHKMACKFLKPARYDEEIDIEAVVTRAGGVRVDHEYEVRRGDEVICVGSTTLACVDAEGRPRALPDLLLPPKV